MVTNELIIDIRAELRKLLVKIEKISKYLDELETALEDEEVIEKNTKQGIKI